MNREFLEGLGLEKEAIDKVMAEHGKTVNATNVKLVEVESTAKALQEQLNQRDADINELKKKTGSSEEMQKELLDLQTKYKSETEDLQTKLTQAKLDAAVELALTKGGARNTTAARALLKADELELTDDGVKGLDEQLKVVMEQNPYLFEENTGGGNPSFSKPGNPNGRASNLSKEDIIKMSDPTERVKAIQDNPNLFK